MATSTLSIASATLNAEKRVVPRNSVKNSSRRMARNVSFVHIDADADYYSIEKQAKIKDTRHFVDSTAPSTVSGSNKVDGLFNRSAPSKNKQTQQTSRTYLSSSISADAYKTGIEITEIGHWLSGLVKISAGTPGHIVQPIGFGIGEASTQASLHSIVEGSEESVISRGAFKEIDLFDPVFFISLQENEKPIDQLITFPIVTADNNQLENYILNGIIEPFPIRPVISNFSINIPFEPHGVRGAYGNGNMSTYMLSDEVLTVDYYDPKKENDTFFLDEGEPIMLSNGTVNVIVGTTIGYFNINQNYMAPFEDKVLPRGEEIRATYPNELTSAVSRLLRQGEVYVTNKQRAATSGFVYDGSTAIGTDSIAFGGMVY